MRSKKIKVENTELIDLRSYHDSRGHLSVAEIGKELPFIVKRVFFIHNIKKNSERANHATKIQNEFIFCLKGSFQVEVNDGKNKSVLKLSGPMRGLYIGRGVWRRLFNFSPGCIILALSDTKYSAKDHINVYDEFLKYKKIK